MYNHSDLEERLRKMLQAPLSGPKARKFENGGSTDPEKTDVKKKRFRLMTPEEVAAEGLPTEESYERGEVPRATFEEQIDIWSQKADEAAEKFGQQSVQHRRYIRMMEDLVRQQKLEEVRGREKRKTIRAPRM